jgi:serine/threonine protein kinase
MPRRDYSLDDVVRNPMKHFSASYLRARPVLYIHIALAIAEGIEELHRADVKQNELGFRKPQILHRDLKPANVLISGQFATIEIADFGSSKAPEVQSRARTRQPGTYDYEAPELLQPDVEYTTMCDIWSYGIILAQMVWRMQLTDQMEVYQMLGILQPQKPQRPLKWPQQNSDLKGIAAALTKVANHCLALDPARRPTAADCVSSLKRRIR